MDTVLRSRSRTVVIGPEQPFCIIGERINPTGRKAFQAQLQAGDLSQLEVDVAEQVAGGADMLDVNVGDPLADEVGLMGRAIRDAPGAHRPAALHRLVGDRGARGRARRLRGQGARQLGHGRGRPARGDPAARRRARRRRDRARERRGHPDGRPSGGSRWRRRSSPRPATTASRPRTSSSTRSRCRSAPSRTAVTLFVETVRLIRDELGVNMTCGASNTAFGLPRRRDARRRVPHDLADARADERDHGRALAGVRRRRPRRRPAARQGRVGRALDRRFRERQAAAAT